MAVVLVAVAGSSNAFTIPPAAFTTTFKSASRSCSTCFSTESTTTSARRHSLSRSSSPEASPAGQLRMSAAEVEAPAVASGKEEEAMGQAAPVDIPTSLPSEAGIDYVPLATMLATGDLKGADQFTRDALIKAAGAGSQKREFVYWTEVKNIPK